MRKGGSSHGIWNHFAYIWFWRLSLQIHAQPLSRSFQRPGKKKTMPMRIQTKRKGTP